MRMLVNGVRDALNRCQHFVIPKPHDFNAFALKILSSKVVFSAYTVFTMLTTVQFNA